MMFLGWGMSPEPFLSLSKPGYDVVLLWGYRQGDENSLDELRQVLARYSEILVIAWSFGVVAASYVLETLAGYPISRKIAINGTPRHIDREAGIPPAIFNLTLKGLSPKAIDKFNARMFVDDCLFANFKEHNQGRDFDSVLSELRFFGKLAPFEGDVVWDFALVGLKDMIFPPDNQLAYWGVTRTTATPFPCDGHFIDLQRVIDDYIVDKELVANRFGSTRRTYRESADAQSAVARRLWVLTRQFVSGSVNTVLEIGVGDGLLTDLYASELSIGELTLLDIAEVDAELLPRNSRFVRCDAEEVIRKLQPESVDMIISASTLQWFHSAEKFLANAYNVLRPGGILAVAFFCEGTYREVAAVTGVSLKYPDPSKWNVEGEILVSEQEEVVATFDTPSEAVRHISHTGVNALRRDSSTSVGAGLRLLRGLKPNTEGKVALTFVPCYLVIRKPAVGLKTLTSDF